MRTSMFLFSVSIFTLLVALQPTDAGDAKKPIKATQTVDGKFSEDAASKVAPKNGYFTDQKALEDLWTAWKLKDKAPTVDFMKQIVFVQLSLGGPNVPRTSYFCSLPFSIGFPL